MKKIRVNECGQERGKIVGEQIVAFGQSARGEVETIVDFNVLCLFRGKRIDVALGRFNPKDHKECFEDNVLWFVWIGCVRLHFHHGGRMSQQTDQIMRGKREGKVWGEKRGGGSNVELD